MKRAVDTATSVHVTGKLRQTGQVIGLNLGVQRSGDLAGTITENGAPLQVIVTGGTSYVKATAAFLKVVKQSASICSVICGKWIELPSSRARQLTGSLSLSSLTRALARKPPRVTGTGVTAVDGQRAYQLRTTDGAALYVAQSSPHYPLALTAADNSGTVRFSQWNRVPKPAPPPKGQTINVGNLG